jgi:hypothetical protein
MFKPSELSCQSIKTTQYWHSDTLLILKISGRIYYGPFKFRIKKLPQVVKFKNNTITCGTPSEIKLTEI